MKEITIQVPEGKRAQWVDGVLTLVDEKKADTRPVTERVKTFEDACEELGDSHPLVVQYRTIVGDEEEEDYLGEDPGAADIMAYIKLRVVAAALNEGWKPDFEKKEEFWYPWFRFYTKEELEDKDEDWKEKSLWLFGGSSADGANGGLAGAASDYAWTHSGSNDSARLAVKDKNLAQYFGGQFLGIWAEYLTAK